MKHHLRLRWTFLLSLPTKLIRFTEFSFFSYYLAAIAHSEYVGTVVKEVLLPGVSFVLISLAFLEGVNVARQGMADIHECRAGRGIEFTLDAIILLTVIGALFLVPTAITIDLLDIEGAADLLWHVMGW